MNVNEINGIGWKENSVIVKLTKRKVSIWSKSPTSNSTKLGLIANILVAVAIIFIIC